MNDDYRQLEMFASPHVWELTITLDVWELLQFSNFTEEKYGVAKTNPTFRKNSQSTKTSYS